VRSPSVNGFETTKPSKSFQSNGAIAPLPLANTLHLQRIQLFWARASRTEQEHYKLLEIAKTGVEQSILLQEDDANKQNESTD
jgi:hypothetical protein